jgi:hypothetical protein
MQARFHHGSIPGRRALSERPGAADAWYDGVDSDCAGNSDYDRDRDGSDSTAY